MNDLHTFGSGCAGSNRQTPALALAGSGKIGQRFRVALTGALPSAIIYLNISAQTFQPPVNMRLFGGGNCRIYSPIGEIALIRTITSTTGTHGQNFVIPNDTRLVCARAYFQYFCVDRKASPFPFTSSNYGRVLIGNF